MEIGRYKIIGELGRGAMGVVYHAKDPAIGRSVAIKTIRIVDIDDDRQREKLRERLFREARSAGVLSHPNIVTIYDMDEADGLAYIAMAYVNGPTLEKILASPEPLSGARMLRILRQAASALDYAHGKGIVHRDVKPANIMTDEDGSVKITDFGIARLTQGMHSTETRTVAGTPNYMSPEQVQGLAVDGRSDQFSLAVIAYEILTGERPFVGEHLSTIVFKIVAEDPPNANLLNGTLTPRIDEVLRKGLSKKPEDRFPNCSNFVGALELACAESRGWKTLPAGAASAMPTLAVDRAPVAARPLPPPVARTRDDIPVQRSSSRVLPVLMSVFLVAALAAVFAWQAGLITFPPRAQETPVADAAPAAVKPPEVRPAKAAPVAKPSPVVEEPQPAEAVPEKPAAAAPDEDKALAYQAPAAAPKPVPFAAPKTGEDAPPARIVPSTPPEMPRRGGQGRLMGIWVTTNPPGAKALLDGNASQACSTPCMLHGAAGTRHLTIIQPGYRSEYRDITVTDSQLDLPQIALQPVTGTLMVSSNPRGAHVLINGQRIADVTPTVVTLRPGLYTVTVESNGQEKTEKIQLGENLVHLSINLGP